MDGDLERSESKFELRKAFSNFFTILIYIFKNLSVEPVIFFVYLGYIFSNTLQSLAIYRKICQTYNENANNAVVECHYITDADLEDEIQKKSAEWSLYVAMAYLIPAIFSDTILGAYSDKNGRKLILMLSITGLVISEFGYLLVLDKATHFPYWSVLITGFIAGSTGYVAMIPVACNAHLADVTNDRNLLTIRAGIFSIAQSIASVLGATIGGVIYRFSISISIDIELALLLLALLFVLWRVPEKSKLTERRRTSISSKSDSVKGFFAEIFGLLKEGIWSYIRRRIGHRRAFVFITVFVLMLSYTTLVETRLSSIMNTYVFRRTDEGSLDWDQMHLGLWNGMGFLTLTLGTFGGLFLFKHVLHARETTIILIGLTSSTVRMIVVGLATKTWQMYLANICGIFAGLVQPATVSFIVQIIPSEEVGRVFSLFGICGDIAFIITTLLYTNIYRITQPWMAGFLFLFIAGLQTISGFAMFWVHIQSRAEGIGGEKITASEPNNMKISIIDDLSKKSYSQRQKTENGKRNSVQKSEQEKSNMDNSWWESLPHVETTSPSFY